MNLQISERIREERERLGIGQRELVERAGLKIRTYANYELGETTPTADAIIKLGDAGIDVMYLLTGRRSEPCLMAHEQALLDLFRKLDERGRGAVFGAAYGYTNPASMSFTIGIGTVSVNAAHSVVTIGSGNEQKGTA